MHVLNVLINIPQNQKILIIPLKHTHDAIICRIMQTQDTDNTLN